MLKFFSDLFYYKFLIIFLGQTDYLKKKIFLKESGDFEYTYKKYRITKAGPHLFFNLNRFIRL